MKKNEIKDYKSIRNAYLMGIVMAALTTIVSTFQLVGYNYWNFLDVFILIILTYWIYKKGKYASIVMLIYYLLSQIIFVFSYFSEENRQPIFWPTRFFIVIVISIIFVEAARAAIDYSRYHAFVVSPNLEVFFNKKSIKLVNGGDESFDDVSLSINKEVLIRIGRQSWAGRICSI